MAALSRVKRSQASSRNFASFSRAQQPPPPDREDRYDPVLVVDADLMSIPFCRTSRRGGFFIFSNANAATEPGFRKGFKTVSVGQNSAPGGPKMPDSDVMAGSEQIPSSRKSLKLVRSTFGEVQARTRDEIGYDS